MERPVHELRHYITEGGRDLVQEWLDRLPDTQARVAVLRRLDRIAAGNFGDLGYCRDGVWELRVDLGPGYRVYFARDTDPIVILLCGGDKRKQQADIARAVRYWKDAQQGHR